MEHLILWKKEIKKWYTKNDRAGYVAPSESEGVKVGVVHVLEQWLKLP